MKELNIICNLYNIGNLKTYEKLSSSQNIVFKIKTDKGNYIVKKYHKDAIKNYYHLTKRKKQIKIVEMLNKKGVSCVLPIKKNKKIFLKYDNNYYVVYPYCDGIYKTVDELEKENIIDLAKNQSQIHQVSIKENLPCTYKFIEIDFNYVLKKYKYSQMICDLIIPNKAKLEELIKNCNANISVAKNNLCISHNDYKPLNILWNNDKPILLDFDAMGKVNPTCALCESAFALSAINGGFDTKRYELYLQSYIEDYGKLSDDFILGLFVCMNGKLSWFRYLIDSNREKDLYYMLKELILFCDNINVMEEIYKKISVN